jgi:hypothetical protein
MTKRPSQEMSEEMPRSDAFRLPTMGKRMFILVEDTVEAVPLGQPQCRRRCRLHECRGRCRGAKDHCKGKRCMCDHHAMADTQGWVFIKHQR